MGEHSVCFSFDISGERNWTIFWDKGLSKFYMYFTWGSGVMDCLLWILRVLELKGTLNFHQPQASGIPPMASLKDNTPVCPDYFRWWKILLLFLKATLERWCLHIISAHILNEQLVSFDKGINQDKEHLPTPESSFCPSPLVSQSPFTPHPLCTPDPRKPLILFLSPQVSFATSGTSHKFNALFCLHSVQSIFLRFLYFLIKKRQNWFLAHIVDLYDEE